MAEEQKCQNCGKGFIPTCHITGQKFCSDACRNRYHSAKGHYGVPVNICPECGDKVEQEGGPGRWRRFCSDQCRVRYHQKKVSEQRAQRERPKQICPNCGKEYEPQWAGGVRLVCGTTCMYTGLDGLTAIVRYHLKLDPYDGSVYVFRDGTGSMLKYIEWDGCCDG